MEKTLTNVLIEDPNLTLMLNRIRDVTRTKTQTIPCFKNKGQGCIKVVMRPLVWETDVWLGHGLSCAYGQDSVLDTVDREWTFTVQPRGSHDMSWESPDDGHIELVNCSGYASLKIAYRDFMDRHDMSQARDLTQFCEENGWSMHRGAVLSTIGFKDKPILKVFVCVSGAKSDEDEQCALEGLSIANAMFTNAGLSVIKSDVQNIS